MRLLSSPQGTIEAETKKIIASIIPQGEPKEDWTTLISKEIVLLAQNHASISINGDTATSIDILPAAYCSILGKKERNLLLKAKKGLIAILKEAIPKNHGNSNNGEMISALSQDNDQPTQARAKSIWSFSVLTALVLSSKSQQQVQAPKAGKLPSELEEKIKQLAETTTIWDRFQLKIDGENFPTEGNNRSLDIVSFRSQIEIISGKNPSDVQILEMLTIMNNEGRVAGFSTGSTGSQTGLCLDGSDSKIERETVDITYTEGKFIYTYQSEDACLRKIKFPEKKDNETYLLLDAQGNPSDKTSQLFKTRRFYTLEYTPPNKERQPPEDDIAKRITLTDSRQGFYLASLQQPTTEGKERLFSTYISPDEITNDISPLQNL
ncbi:MAG: hypothetical protein ACOYK6_02760 [Chthoniobacterales bacterium]